jgi:hypothetical protein
VHVVVNARTDLFFRQDGDEADRIDQGDSPAGPKAANRRRTDVISIRLCRHDPDTCATCLDVP